VSETLFEKQYAHKSAWGHGFSGRANYLACEEALVSIPRMVGELGKEEININLISKSHFESLFDLQNARVKSKDQENIYYLCSKIS
jgi:hypothetical protein